MTTRARSLPLLLVALVGCSDPAPPSPPFIHYQPLFEVAQGRSDVTQGRFEVVGLLPRQLAAFAADADLRAAALVVRVDGSDTPLLGTTGVTDGILWMKPRFPLARGVRHVATFDPSDGTQQIFELTPERNETPPPTVVAVFPSGDAIPENVLKFYLHFNVPMARGESARRVRVLDAAGTPVEMPFLELDEELWDTTGTRLTLFIDPGRIKQGVKPREDIGTVFAAGARYTLEVVAGWPDASGFQTAPGFTKDYAVGPPLAEQIDVAKWTLTATPTAVSATFPRPLDRALLERAITVRDAKGEPVLGRVEVTASETAWRFVPATPLAAGEYRLRVGTELEDVAGNRTFRLFDTPGEAVHFAPPVERRFPVGG